MNRRMKTVQEEFAKETRMNIGVIRCMTAHCEICEVSVRSKNGFAISDPNADIEITAKLKVRDFTTDSWERSGSGAGRKNLNVIIDLENAMILYKNEELRIVNSAEILDGVQELLTGAQRDRVPLRSGDGSEDSGDIHPGDI